ncbi:MAG TPA: isoprenylcysteine carboxylmethyltransferase family protein [Terriglobales bacterium]
MAEGNGINWRRVARRVRVPLSFLFAFVYLYVARPTWMSIGVGGAIAAFGLWVRAIASGHVKKDKELATTGPYAYTRNPLYLGSTIIAIGFAIAGCNVWIGVALVALYLAIYVPVIRGEEEYLTLHFPEYAEYKQRVPRLIPRLSAGAEGRSTFSPQLYWQHREYQALLGAAFMLAALTAKLLWSAR